MRAFGNLNPIVITVYYLSAISILMFSQSPVLLVFGFAGAFAYSLIYSNQTRIRTHLFYLLLFTVLTAVNPLFSHNGKTVLFVINNAPFTLEALVYGAVSAGGIITVLYLFSSFSEIMTRDKLLYTFGALSPKAALVLSMGLRYVTLLSDRAKIISDSQKALGLYKEDNIFDKIKGDLRVFSILITWALENGITTADSMAARGYGQGKRTYFTLFKFRKNDVFVLLFTLVCDALTVISISYGALGCTFYPSFEMHGITPLGIIGATAYGALAVLPIITEIKEGIKWKCLRSKI